MPRLWKSVKKYERWFLLAIVIIILATFSVSSQCSGNRMDRGSAALEQLGGAYEAAQGRRETVSGDEFERTRRRYAPVHRVPLWGPSLRYADEFASNTPETSRLSDDQATWAHIATVGAAREAGYEVGEEELRGGVRKMVERLTQRAGGRGGMPFSPEIYEQVLAYYRLDRIEFETTVREILLKDKFLAPLLDGIRFAKDRAEAFEAWKVQKERVDLEFAAVPAAQFQDRVKLEEDTRSTIAAQALVLAELVEATHVVRRVVAVANDAKNKPGGALPKDEAALLALEGGKSLAAKPAAAPKPPAPKPPTDPKAPVDPKAPAEPAPAEPAPRMLDDPWGKPYVYRVTGDTFTVASFGPDGKEGTADDVDRGTVAVLESAAALRRIADGLVQWRATADAWPATLPELTKAPPPAKDKRAAPAPLATLPADGWAREFVYDPAGPTLLSTGADGQKGTPDDLSATVTADRATVPFPAAFAAFVKEGAKDAYGAPLTLTLKTASPETFEVRSAGPDGAPGTADDLIEGNELDLVAFYNRVRMDYRIPDKREFEAVYVIPCLVPDALLAAAWAKFPEFRPDETRCFDFFRTASGSYYLTTKKGDDGKDVALDPADPKEGYAVALVEALRKEKAIPADGTVTPVPGAAAFGEQKDPAADAAKAHADDPQWKLYVEKGWRRILLRELFFENLVADVLAKCRAAADAKKAWAAAGRTGTEPAAVTFTQQFERFKDMQPGEADAAKGARFVQYFAVDPKAPLSREEWEKLPELGDINTSEALKSLKDDDYAAIPTLLRGGTIHAAFHNVRTEASREPDLKEIRAKVFPAYVESRYMERADKELSSLVAKLKEKDAKLADVVAAAAKERNFTYSIGRTGPFVGSAPSQRPLTAEAGASDEAKAELARRNYVRKFGYDEIRETGRTDAPAAAVGAVGRKVLRDEAADSTRSAYLVRVAWAQDPSPEEFHAREYARWLAEQTGSGDVFGGRGAAPKKDGTVSTQLDRLFRNWDAIRRLYGIDTISNLDAPAKKVR